MVQWLRLHAPNAGGPDLIPGQGTKILHATSCRKKKLNNNEKISEEVPLENSEAASLCQSPLRLPEGSLISTFSVVPD